MVEFFDELPPKMTVKPRVDSRLKEVEELVHAEMALWGLHKWTFKFDGGKRRYGQCDYMNKTISLSRHLVLLNSLEDTRDTILHEIAHALVGPGNGHNTAWKNMCAKVGAVPVTCHSAKTAPFNYHLHCGLCDRFLIGRYRKTKTAIVSKCCQAPVRWYTVEPAD